MLLLTERHGVSNGVVAPHPARVRCSRLLCEQIGRMSTIEEERAELKGTGYELFVGALSILSMVNIVLIYVFRRDENLQDVLLVMNALLTVIFLVDFVYRLFTAASKSDYFLRQFGWADLLASLPFKQVKVFRIFRVVRVMRFL